MSQSNQCTECGKGKLLCHTTRTNKSLGVRTRYFKCSQCGFAPPKQVLSLSIAPVSEGMEQCWGQRKLELNRVK